MKKFGIAIFSIMVLVVSTFFAGCRNTPDNKEINAVSAVGLRDAYYVTETIDFSSVNLVVGYSDGSTETLTNGEVDLQDASARQEDTQFILYTSGLSTATERQEGSYPISCLIVGEETARSLMTIEINDDMSLVYELSDFSDPQFVEDYERNYNLAYNSGSTIGAEGYTETAFMLTAGYTVGNDNEFIYKPQFQVFDKEDPTLAVNVNINVEVEVRENGNIVGNNIYTFNNETYGFKFTDEAIGHTYTITMRPADWDLDELMLNESSFTITVADGYNVYRALDLGRINLLDDSNLPKLENIQNYRQSVRNIFYDIDTKTYKNLKYYELWEEFLTGKGETDLHEINGVYLHGNITVTAQDIPEEYFVTSYETSNEAAVGTLRDFAFLYSHYMFNNFTLNGNLFAIDFSNIKAGMSNAVLGNTSSESNIGGYLDIFEQETDFAEPGHSTAFAFIGYEGSPVATVCNIDAKGNMSTAYSSSADNDEVQMDAVGAAGSIMFIKSIFGVTNVYNIIAKEFLIALYMEGEWGYKTMDISNSKVFDCFNSGLFAYGSDNNTIGNSHLERFGGPVIFLISITRTEAVYESGITVDANSKLQNFVHGDEGWFALTGGDAIIPSAVGVLDGTALNNYGATILQEDPEDETQTMFNLLVLVMDNGYLQSDKTDIRGSFKYGERAEFYTGNPALTDNLGNGRDAAFFTDGGDALTMTSSNGQTLLALNGTPILPESMAELGLPYQTYDISTSGDYINVLYRYSSTTIGVVFEMYEYPASTATE